MDILVAHGVNLDLLGSREPNVYGSLTLSALNHRIALDGQTLSKALGLPNPSLTFFQSNREDEFLLKISEQFDGILMNPGAWTHTSLALADRLRAVKTPYVEVHISNVAAREPFRHTSYAAPQASGVVYGFGGDSYRVGLLGLMLRISAIKNKEGVCL
jgi:3-dehydroquinate dehydratase-2